MMSEIWEIHQCMSKFKSWLLGLTCLVLWCNMANALNPQKVDRTSVYSKLISWKHSYIYVCLVHSFVEHSPLLTNKNLANNQTKKTNQKLSCFTIILAEYDCDGKQFSSFSFSFWFFLFLKKVSFKFQNIFLFPWLYKI